MLYMRSNYAILLQASSILVCLLCTSCSGRSASSISDPPLTVPFSNLSANRLLSDDQAGGKNNSGLIETRASEVLSAHLQARDEKKVMSALQSLSLCHHPLAIDILSKHILDESPFIQLASIQSLAMLKTERAKSLLIQSLKSPYIPIRLEALWSLIDMGDKNALHQIDALRAKFPDEVSQYLPDLYAKEGSEAALQELYKMAYGMNDEVVAKIFLALARFQRIEAENFILSYKSHSPIVLEAQAKALEMIPGDASLNMLTQLSRHTTLFVRMRALASRVSIGDESAMDEIAAEYQSGNSLILAALLSIKQPKKIPLDIHPYGPQDIDTILYLLRTGSPNAKNFLGELLTPSKGSKEGMVLMPSLSPGGTITFWRYSPMPPISSQDQLFYTEQSLELKEAILKESMSYGREYFLALSDRIAERGDIDLYPCLFESLLEMPLEDFHHFCMKYSHTPGAPLLRSYIALYSMKRKKKLDIRSLNECFQLARAHDNEKNKENFRFVLPWISREASIDDWNSNGSEESLMPLQATSRLYLLSCQLTLELAGANQAQDILVEQLSHSPADLAPFVAAALLEAAL